MKEKVVLAYSGGLDTTAIIPWLKETYGYEVVCCCINCGQGEELDGLEERAKLSGASKLYIEDITDEFCDDYIVAAPGILCKHLVVTAGIQCLGRVCQFLGIGLYRSQRLGTVF